MNEPQGSSNQVLTGREREVLDLLRNGADNHTIATTLAISEKTVEAHLSRIYSKLGVRNRLQALIHRIA